MFVVSMCKHILYNNNEAVFNFLCSTDEESGFTIIGVLSIVIGWVFCELWVGFFSSEYTNKTNDSKKNNNL